MIQINGADKMESTVRLFVPTQTTIEKKYSQILINKLSDILEGFTITPGKGMYRIRETNKLVNDRTTVIEISDHDELKIKSAISLLKEYGLSAHEETVFFNLDGISYISEPEKLEVK